MKAEHISDAIGMLDDDILDETQRFTPKRRPPRRLWIGLAAAACFCLLLELLWGGGFAPSSPPEESGTESGDTSAADPHGWALAEAVYPETVKHPHHSEGANTFAEWQAALDAQRTAAEGCGDGLEGYFTATMRQFLSSAGEENRVFSPLNLYMSLAMLAEISDGESRAQLLTLLGATDLPALRTQAQAVWRATYRDDGSMTGILANSLWLRHGVTYRADTVNRLADTYYASVYQGVPGTPEYDALLQSWLNEQTGGLLAEQARNVQLDSSTVLALASTLYYRAQWEYAERFYEKGTKEGVFHSPTGDVLCDFMHKSMARLYYRGENFGAVRLTMRDDGGAMWLFLPDEGVSMETLVGSEEVVALMNGYEDWTDARTAQVELALPKFDVSAESDLIEGLKALGITDVFDGGAADFRPIMPQEQAVLSRVTHAVRVAVDEEGCTAAAFTLDAVSTSIPNSPEVVDFTLDRPFLFAVTGMDELVLFAGVVNQP